MITGECPEISSIELANNLSDEESLLGYIRNSLEFQQPPIEDLIESPMISNYVIKRVLREYSGSKILENPNSMEVFQKLNNFLLDRTIDKPFDKDLIKSSNYYNNNLIGHAPFRNPLAQCRNFEPNIFYDKNTVKQAKNICKTCPVRKECLTYALINGEKQGIWGGKSSRERRNIIYKIRLGKTSLEEEISAA